MDVCLCLCACLAMRLMSAIVVVAAEVNAQAVMTKRRCEMEKSKRAEHRAIGREEELENSLKEVTHKQTNKHTNPLAFIKCHTRIIQCLHLQKWANFS